MATEGSAVETMESVLDIATRRAGLKSEVGRDDRSAPERPPLTVAKSLPPDPEVTKEAGAPEVHG